MSATKAFLMLTSRAQRYDSVGRGFGGLTPAIVASLCSGLPRSQFLMAMATEARDFGSLGTLELELWRAAAEMAESEQWPMEAGEAYLRRFAGLAVLEALSARPLPCTACRGRGFKIFHSNGVACDECQNSGGRKISSKTRAELVGVPWTRWREGWDARYEAVHWIAVNWRNQALSHLAHGLEGMRV